MCINSCKENTNCITKFLECFVPVSVCNLECEYCYIIQQKRRKMENPEWKYTPEWISKALRKERLGGMAYISLCGAGETLVSNDVIKLAYLLLEEGHAVNITTNGTLSRKFDEFVKFPKECLKRLNFSFSFHYLELKKKNMLDDFFDNIDKIRKLGCSFVLQLNLYDEYIPYLDEIKEIAVRRTGALPQVAVTRREVKEKNGKRFEFFTNGSDERYIDIARSFDSPLFECTLKNFNVKRNEFCYAGMWSGVLNLYTGVLSKCYGLGGANIFEDVDSKIDFSPVGRHCPQPYCVNSSHFMSLGVIPNADTPSYASLRNREEAGWYNETMKELLSDKLKNYNNECNFFQKIKLEIYYMLVSLKRKGKTAFRKLIKRI